MKKFSNNLSALVVASFFTFLFSSCGDNGLCKRGKGGEVVREIDLESVTAIEANGSFDVVVMYGDEQKIEAIGNDNIIQELNTSVSNGLWKVELNGGCYRKFDLEVRITSPRINSLASRGSGDLKVKSLSSDLESLKLKSTGSGELTGDVDVMVNGNAEIISTGSGGIEWDGLSADELEVEVTGSGDVEINRGAVADQDVVVTGSGNYEAYGLNSEEAKVKVTGSGNALVNVDTELKATIRGSGDIRYKGNPALYIEEDSGSGQVQKK